VRAAQEHQVLVVVAADIGAAAAAHNMQVAVVARHTRRQEFMELCTPSVQQIQALTVQFK
jgi:hypothetical protein